MAGREPVWSPLVRAMTWNLWWRFGPRWRERQHGISQTLRAVDADLVALQEVWGAARTTQAQQLADRLGFYHAFSAPSLPSPPDPPEAGDQVGIEVGLGLLSRWPITRIQPVEMPACHRAPAVILLATVNHPAGPLHILVACLEWEARYNNDRFAQAQALADLAADPALNGPTPVLVAGDLNAAPGSSVLRPLTDVFVDAWAAAGGDPSAVTLSSSHPFAPVEVEELIDQRIDHVLLRPGHPGQRLCVEKAVLAGQPVGGLDPSDHRAVVCDFRWTTCTGSLVGHAGVLVG